MVETGFENEKFLMFKIGRKKFCSHGSIYMDVLVLIFTTDFEH